MFIGFFDFCLELMDGYKIWLVCTVIMCLLLLKFQYSSMLEIHNDDSDYPDDDEFDDEEPAVEAGEKQAKEEPVVQAQASRETETVVEEEIIVNQATEEFEDSEMENAPVSEHVKTSSAGTEPAIEMPPAVEISGEKEVTVELTPQQQKIDNILTFLSITFCFFVFSGLIMKILLFILGLILTFVGGIFESILGIVLAVIFFILLAFIL